MHRTSVVSLQADTSPELLQRKNTLTTYVTRDMADSLVTKINRYYRKNKSRGHGEVKCLKWAIKPKIKSMLYTHSVWGSSYYNQVLTKAHISEKLFIRAKHLTPSKKKTSRPLKPNNLLLNLAGNEKLKQPTFKPQGKSELSNLEYELEKQQEQASVHSKHRSAYSRFLDMVNTNLLEPKTLEERIERQQLLKRCEGYRHLRDVAQSGGSLARKQSNPSRSPASPKTNDYQTAVRNSVQLLQLCRLQHTEHDEVRNALCAFSGFCKMFDQNLLRRKKQLSPEL